MVERFPVLCRHFGSHFTSQCVFRAFYGEQIHTLEVEGRKSSFAVLTEVVRNTFQCKIWCHTEQPKILNHFQWSKVSLFLSNMKQPWGQCQLKSLANTLSGSSLLYLFFYLCRSDPRWRGYHLPVQA